jgi:hypothetical protein
MKKIPKLLYRYRALGRPSFGRHSHDPDAIESDTFIKSALYFPSRLQFNDKSDCLMPAMSHITDDQFRELVRQRVYEEFKEIPVAGRGPFADKMNSFSRTKIERMLQEGVDCLGILSLTTKPDNPVMWAWYANNHKGMCLGFDTSDEMFQAAHPMAYLSKARRYTLGAHAANAEEFVLTKKREWKYEDEWRIISPVARKLYPFKPEALTHVIFGLETSDRDRNKVDQWIANGPCRPRRYKAILRKDSRTIGIVLLP